LIQKSALETCILDPSVIYSSMNRLRKVKTYSA
jgi:hypothetical protein